MYSQFLRTAPLKYNLYGIHPHPPRKWGGGLKTLEKNVLGRVRKSVISDVGR